MMDVQTGTTSPATATATAAIIKSESKYERLRKIGIGSYGVVFKCVNRQSGQVVAIKRYSENDSDPIIRKIAMREVRMLRQLKHCNLIQLIEVFRRKRRLHLVFDYCELTVLDVIEKYGPSCPLNLIKKIIWQLVNGVTYCHQHNCIHRDIKPENILINQAGVVKLCDFGFARNIQSPSSTNGSSLGNNNHLQQQQQQHQHHHHYQQQQQQQQQAGQLRQLQLEREARLLGVPLGPNKENASNQQAAASASDRQALTEYVATRWYRAPELLVGEIYYDVKIDIWAIGCVTAELMRGEPVWPGKTDLDQLYMIKSSLGDLTASQTHTLLTRNLYDQANLERLLNQTPANASDSVERKLPVRVGQPAVDFVASCLQMEPARRPPSDELLRHHYIHSVRMAQFVRGASEAPTPSSASHTSATATGGGDQSTLLPLDGAHRRTDTITHNQPGELLGGGGGGVGGGVGGGGPASVRSNSQALLMAANSKRAPAMAARQVAAPANKRLPLATATGTLNSQPRAQQQVANGQPWPDEMALQQANNSRPTGFQASKVQAHKRKRQASGQTASTSQQTHQQAANAGVKPSLVPILSRQRTSSKQIAAAATTTTSVLMSPSARAASELQHERHSSRQPQKSNTKRRQPQPRSQQVSAASFTDGADSFVFSSPSKFNLQLQHQHQHQHHQAMTSRSVQAPAGAATKAHSRPSQVGNGKRLLRLKEEPPT